jgi:hypothetical protein
MEMVAALTRVTVEVRGTPVTAHLRNSIVELQSY